ncbi:T9SS type B sorting domain-containing protein [Flavobacterium sp. MFBS3-15]|uniref:T9SS type B sorting domain-containing protein n=1 Tax=Flavobacterium sp. MFBS3-15 TaxID=2989816 RepID=UPI00223675BD|nr:T9SS type B sorting domain-containing protein [Flavobacterium sp. MFBS3-15]MCW4468071.1 T9SS type B sorting domain-containing protein [Flavobacterium sp. MFBS3-15]
MQQKNKKHTGLIPLLQFFFVLFSGYAAQAQIYYHNFGTTTINSHPYTASPATLAPNLSGSSWTNSIGTWTSNTGATGQGIMVVTTPATTTITLTFNVTSPYHANITSFNFWTQRSSSGHSAWSMSINGINAGSGTMPTAGTSMGVTPVANAVSGLTGTVTVVLTLTGATGNGFFRLDDFTLNGSVGCTNSVTSYTPLSGPKDTMITITGSGFSDTASVKIDGINMTYNVISDTQIEAMIPAGVTTGNISVTSAAGCVATAGTPFTLLASDCTSPEIYISEIYDAYSGTPGSIELYNPSTQPINLSGYRLLRYGDINLASPNNNAPDYNMALTGTINPQSCYMVSINITAACPGVATHFPLTNGINANDEFELFNPSNELIDNVHIPFGTGDNSGKGYTMIRKPNAVAPKEVFALADWNAYGDEFCSNLGIHTANGPSAPLPLITHPVPRTICVNANTAFNVIITPATGFTYQWKMLTASGTWVNVTNNATYNGATTATLTVNGAQVAMDGNQYYLEATSPDCVVRTDAAQLYVLEKPEAPTVTVVQPTCTTPTGTIEITAPLSDPGDPNVTYTYSINGVTYVESTTFENLTPGTTYNITAKNVAGCVSNITVQVINTVPGAPAAPVVTAEQPDCDTDRGTITVTPPAGTGYTYSINGTDYYTNPVFTNLLPGSYNVSIRQNGCTSAITVEVIDDAPEIPVAPQVTPVPPTCTTPGSITVNSPVGAGITYSKDGINYQPETLFDNLTPGTSYSITAKNADGCVSAITVQAINAVPGAPDQPTVVISQPDCDTATGWITITAPIGNGLTYSVNGTDYLNQTGFTLNPGTHNITVKNTAGCISVARVVVINDQPEIPIAPNVTVDQPGCGEENGSITINSPLGTGLTYSINGTDYFDTLNFEDVQPGTYSITVKNTAGCISTVTSGTVNSGTDMPSLPVLDVTQPDCVDTTGSIEVTFPSQSPGITYSKNGVDYQSSPVFDNLTPGASYSITVKNSSGCISTATVQSINTIPTAPATPTVTFTNPDCDTPTGSISIATPDASLTYSLDGVNYNPYPSAAFATVNPGNYSITAKNAAGCVSVAFAVVIADQPETPVAPTLNAEQPDCDTPKGTIMITNPTGTGLTYSKDGVNYQDEVMFTNLDAGTYNITVKNAAGCISPVATQIINAAPATPAAPDVAVVQPDCITTTGTATISPAVAGLEYSKGDNVYQTNPVFNGLVPGQTYNFTARNADGCISAITVRTVDNIPDAPDAPTLTVNQPGCTTAGSITVANPTGNGLTYSRNGVDYSSNPSFTNLSAGTYNITVKNTAGCVSAPTVQMIDPAPPIPAAPQLISGQPDCETPTGSITVTNPAGAGFTYSRNGVDYQTEHIFYDVPPGMYSVTIKSPEGCISPATSHTINPVPATPAAPVVTVTQPTCIVSTGTITVTPPAGGAPEYSKDGINYQASPVFSGLTPGTTYTITIRNAAGCVSTATVRTIDPIPAPPAPPALTGIDPGCTTLGSITITSPSAGNGFTFSKDGVNFQTSETFGGLVPGTYQIRVKNSQGCVSDSATYVINPGPSTPAQPTVSIVQTTCTATTATITVTAPLAGVTYCIDGLPGQTSNIFNNVLPGQHNITVTNATGCISPVRVVTINPVPVAPDVPILNVFHPGCNATKGSIIVNSPAGNGISYSINGGDFQFSPAFGNLDPGTYTIVVKNAAGCLSTPVTVTINIPPATPAAPVITINQPDCTTATGSITIVSPTDPGTMFSINSQPYQAGPTIGNLAPGSYVITARNAQGCVSAYTHFIINYQPLTPAMPVVTLTQPDCTTATGTITVNSPAGIGLEYSIDGTNFYPSRIFSNVLPNTYTVTVRNSAGCSAQLTAVTINNPPAPAPDPGAITGNNAVCEGGKIQLANTVTVGVWGSSNTGIATVDANGLVTTLAPGTVTITYTTGTDCTDEAIHVITVYALPLPDLRDMHLCVDNETGEITPALLSSRIISPGNTYEWTHNGTVLTFNTAAIIIDEPGEYTVKVTNIATGCEATDSATVGTSSLALGYADAATDFHFNQTITVHITGGSGDYEYSLDGGPFQDEPYFTNIYEGEYHISVRDKHLCGTLELDVYALNYPRFFSPNGDGTRDTWNIKGLGLQPDAKIYIFDRYGKVIAGLKPGGPGWDGTYNGATLPATDYWFTLEYRSESGAQKEFKAHFSLIR